MTMLDGRATPEQSNARATSQASVKPRANVRTSNARCMRDLSALGEGQHNAR